MKGRAAGQGQVALAVPQRPRRQVHRHQRGGAGGVDRHRRALEAERVGDAAGGDAARSADRLIALGPRPIGAVAGADEDAGGLALQLVGRDPGVLQRLPGGFQEQALLGVHRRRLARGDAEELGVEVGCAVEEAALAGVAGAGVVGVGVVEALEVPAAVGGEGADRVALLVHELPELLWRGDPAGQAAGHAEDRDRLLALGDPSRGAPGRGGRIAHPLQQVSGQRSRRGVVEDRGRGEPQAGRLLEAVAQLDRGERVEAELLEGVRGPDPGRGGMAEDRGHLGADEVLGNPATGLGRRLGETAGERSPSPARGRLHLRCEARQQRVQGAGPGPGPQRYAIERKRRAERIARGERAVEEGEAALVGERGDAAAAHPRHVGLLQPPGHRALALPQPPGDRGGGEPFGAALPGQRVEVAVGGGVGALARCAEEAGDRGEADEVGQLQLPGQLVQVAGAVDLGGEDALHLLGSRALHGGVVEDGGAVDDGAEGVLGVDA